MIKIGSMVALSIVLTGLGLATLSSKATPAVLRNPERVTADPPDNIDLTTTMLMGEQLAEAAGIPRTEWERGACEAWVEITDGGAVGYCIPFGLTRSPNETYRVGRLLRSLVPSDELVSTVDDLLEGSAGAP